MAIQSSLKNMVICLTAVCLVCGSILAGVYALTKTPIENAAAAATQKAIGEVLPQGCEISEEMCCTLAGTSYSYYAACRDGEVVAYAVKSVTNGFGGALELMVGVEADAAVYATKVLSHSETPGLGAKCTSDEKFISQWKGYKGVFTVKNDGGDVDAITASTITSRAYTKAVEQAVNVVKSLRGAAVSDAVTGASMK